MEKSVMIDEERAAALMLKVLQRSCLKGGFTAGLGAALYASKRPMDLIMRVTLL
jgi:hypothetical protein